MYYCIHFIEGVGIVTVPVAIKSILDCINFYLISEFHYIFAESLSSFMLIQLLTYNAVSTPNFVIATLIAYFLRI